MSEDSTTPPEQATYGADEPLARVEQLQHDFVHNPAITCPFTFNWHGNQELADTASMRIRIYG
jgi:hypothetical protein